LDAVHASARSIRWSAGSVKDESTRSSEQTGCRLAHTVISVAGGTNRIKDPVLLLLKMEPVLECITLRLWIFFVVDGTLFFTKKSCTLAFLDSSFAGICSGQRESYMMVIGC
jgi:hypothetical protein